MHAYIGAAGAGKTYTMQAHATEAVRAGWCFVVLDQVNEWPGPHPGWSGVEVTTTSDVRAAQRCVMAGRELTVLRPQRGTNAAAILETIAGTAIAAPSGVVVCVPEADRALREHSTLGPHVRDILHRWRHPDMSARIWWDTQQLADVKKEALAAATRIHLFGGATWRDSGIVRKLGGPELECAIDNAGDEALRGTKGYHVALSPLSSRPPFKLQRA